jgi:hypothetical protein
MNCPVVMSDAMVMHGGVMMMMPHQGDAGAVPPHLSVSQAAAPAHRLLRRMGHPVMRVFDPAVRVPDRVMRMSDAVVGMRRPMMADVDPAMPRRAGRHRRERRWRFRGCLLIGGSSRRYCR